MILARCPACATTFRVRPEQLRARQGRVRCGQCNHAFNALDNVVDENVPHPAPETPTPFPLPAAPAASGHAPLFVLEEKESPAAPELPPSTPATTSADGANDEPPAGDVAAIPDPGLAVHNEAEEPWPLDIPTAATPEYGDDDTPAATASTPPSSDADAEAEAEAELAIPPDGAADVIAPTPEITWEQTVPLATEPGDSAQPPAGPLPLEPVPEILDEDLDFLLADDTAPAPASADAMPPAPDERIEPTGEIALPEEEWSAVDDTPVLPPSPDRELAAGDPLLEFGLDDDFPVSEPATAQTPAPPQDFKADWPDPTDLDLQVPSAAAEPVAGSVVDFDSLLRKEDHGELPLAAETPAALAGRDAVPTSTAQPEEMRATEPAAEPLRDTAVESESDAEDDAAPAEPSALNQALWAAGATLLALVLLAQGVLVFRNEIALSSPQTRPALEALCNTFGCDLPLPREAAEIAIESSDIQPDASREAFFTLHATLRNRAEFEQAWPHLEITLTDARDKPLVRRVLEPAQWRPADAPKDAFPARREIAARVAFEAPGVAAAGYRVYAFYP